MISSDYLVITVPTVYLYTGSNLVVVNSSVDLSSNLGLSLCQSTLYFCSHYSNNALQIKVQEVVSGNFQNLTFLKVAIKNGFYRSPISFSASVEYFYADLHSGSNLLVDITNSLTNLVLATFYLTCQSSVLNHCK
jgi:hypothetical protein